MAVTKVFAIRARFEKTVQYAANEQKTSLDGMINYAVNLWGEGKYGVRSSPKA